VLPDLPQALGTNVEIVTQIKLALIAACFHVDFLLGFFSTLKLEACSSEMSVDFKRTKQCHSPDDRTIYNIKLSRLQINMLSLRTTRLLKKLQPK
jgi:hypothetical protein